MNEAPRLLACWAAPGSALGFRLSLTEGYLAARDPQGRLGLPFRALVSILAIGGFSAGALSFEAAGYSGCVFVALARVARVQFSIALPGFYACFCIALFLSPQAALFIC